MIEGLRYKLRMMGIEVMGHTAMFCDNESVVKNSTRPEATLKKKHNDIAYHRVCEAQAAKIVAIAHIEGLKNPADIFTKSLPGVPLQELIQVILW
jgi:RPA family protein